MELCQGFQLLKLYVARCFGVQHQISHYIQHLGNSSQENTILVSQR